MHAGLHPFAKCSTNIVDVTHAHVSKYGDNNNGCVRAQTMESNGSDFVKDFAPSFQVRNDVKMLQNLQKFYSIGKLLQACAIEKFIPNNDDENTEI